jgi:hypothetical protein
VPKDRALLTMGDSTRLVEPFLPGLTSHDLFFSYGKTVPDLSSYKTVSYWMGGAYALELKNVGLAQNLCSPGPLWLPDLPFDLVSRKIYSGVIEELKRFSGDVWAKPSEAKVPCFPAAKYSYAELSKIFAENNLVPNLSIQWTPDILPIDFEHRFFVADNQIITGSPYKVHGIGFGKDIDFSEYLAAKEFAAEVLTNADNPPAFTLDVGMNTETGKWITIEGNRAWSSGIYGSNAEAAITVVDYSCSYAEDKWQWTPDFQLIESGKKWERLTVLPIAEEAIGFYKFEKPAEDEKHGTI